MKTDNRSPVRLHLIEWNRADSELKAASLKDSGFLVSATIPDGSGFMRELEAEMPRLVLIDLNRMPSQGRDIGIMIRKRKKLRQVPLLFLEGRPEKVKKVREILPDAFYGDWSEVEGLIRKALDNSPVNPVVPGSIMDAYKGKPLGSKLNLAPGKTLLLIDPPEDHREVFAEILQNAAITLNREEQHDLTIWFPTGKDSLANNILNYRSEVPLWIAWPKKSSEIPSELNQTIVRKTGLENGFVDYKICSINRTWSALLFTSRQKDKGKKSV